MAKAPVNGLKSFSPETTRALRSISFVTTRSAEMALGLLGRFNVGGPVMDCFRRGGHRHNRVVYGEVRRNRGYTVMASTKVPYVSSPNRSLVGLYRRHKVGAIIVPNPDTIVSTLTISKLRANEFAFRNFLDIGGGDQDRRLSDLGGRREAVVFCRTPRGLPRALQSLCDFFNSEGLSVIQRLAGIRRRMVHAAAGCTTRGCTSNDLGNRFILILRNGGRRRGSRRCALRFTIRATHGLVRGNTGPARTTGRTTDVANFGGGRVCERLLWVACRGTIRGVRSLLAFNSHPKLSQVEVLLSELKGPRSELGFVRVTNAGNGNSIYTVLSSTLITTNCGANLFVSPCVASFHREVRVGGYVIDRSILASTIRGAFPVVIRLHRRNAVVARFRCIGTLRFCVRTGTSYSVIILRAKVNNLLSYAGAVGSPLYTIVAAVKLSRATVLNSAVRGVTRRGYKVFGPSSVTIASGRSVHTVGIVRSATERGGVPLTADRDIDVSIVRAALGNDHFVFGNIRVSLPLSNSRRLRGTGATLTTLSVLHYGSLVSVASRRVTGNFTGTIGPTELRLLDRGPVILLSNTRGPGKVRTLGSTVRGFLPGGCVVTVAKVLTSGSIDASMGLLSKIFSGICAIPIRGPETVRPTGLVRGCTGFISSAMAFRDTRRTFSVTFRRTRGASYTIMVYNSLCLTNRVHPCVVGGVGTRGRSTRGWVFHCGEVGRVFYSTLVVVGVANTRLLFFEEASGVTRGKVWGWCSRNVR